MIDGEVRMKNSEVHNSRISLTFDSSLKIRQFSRIDLCDGAFV
jgi:hypothetical protein